MKQPMKTIIFCLGLLLLPPADASDIQVAFSPNGGATDLVVHTIESAQHSIEMAAYTFTSRPIAEALVAAHRRGVDVRLVVDRRQNYRGYTQARYVEENGISVRDDSQYSIMHNKFIVVDEKTVEEGSFNYTAAAERKNAENVLVLHDRKIAGEYAQEWERLWNESSTLFYSEP
jgi:phosphatidylserine/phosphatidylglycerophosphate/cardiolipin synthase-like enzyme